MDVNNLITMANQIGTFFDSMPDRQQAVQDIAEHIRRFWDPRMRRAILDSLDQHNDEGLSDIVREALSTHRQILAC
ncbi:MAG: NAD-dependent formate dehydrogenase delta subunit [Pseudomonadota bacterium]|jgi:formate dehydrogenase subunit delta|nr:formate dehydrogenase [Oxalobacteraceae bacterium]